MKKGERDFLVLLEKLGSEQAKIDSSSPLPEWLRPAAAFLGEKPWQVLLTSSFIISLLVSVLSYPYVLRLFERGVLAWLLR